MLSKKQKKREPLLYIHQPQFTPPEGRMQETFSIKKAEESKLQSNVNPENEEKKRKKSKGPIEVKEEAPLSSEKVQKTIEEYEEKQTEVQENKHGYGLRRLKPFKEMSIEEKLNYLYQFPKQLPPVPCLFQTGSKALRGLLLEKTEHHIVIRLLDKSEVTVAINELTEVKMIGLN